ncbi:Sister chromatid cohesion protein PDS5 [Fasciola gigantica]|uniref:Sister chromatid cohesion protein PDS5 n=1 Tax=Fasciola gigantica TaxID=46835 RepID=A0A504YCB9_FASGI|nr:Sister chromatid cohesion protein PDS5 [Fasciola gigantica]
MLNLKYRFIPVCRPLRALWFVMEPIVMRGQNFTFLRKIIEKIKHTRDALAPEDPAANLKLYTACDIALGLLLTRCPSLTIKEYPVEVKLPRSLFAAAPASFRNPDFAQLLDTSENVPTDQVPSTGADLPAAAPGKARIQFTPVKHGRALKDGLMPLQLLKGQASNPSVNKAPEPRATEHSFVESDPLRVVVAQLARQSPPSSPTPQQQHSVAVTTKQTKIITVTSQDLAIKEPSQSAEMAEVRVEEPKPSTSANTASVDHTLNSPKKHTQIVLGTPEIESDSTNSPISRVKKRGRPPKSTQCTTDKVSSVSPNGHVAKFRKLDFTPPRPRLSTKSPVRKNQSSTKNKSHISQDTSASSGTLKARTRLAMPKNRRTVPSTKTNVLKKVRNSPSVSKSSKLLASMTPKSRKNRKMSRSSAVNTKQRLLSQSSSSFSSNSRLTLRSPVTRNNLEAAAAYWSNENSSSRLKLFKSFTAGMLIDVLSQSAVRRISIRPPISQLQHMDRFRLFLLYYALDQDLFANLRILPFPC